MEKGKKNSRKVGGRIFPFSIPPSLHYSLLCEWCEQWNPIWSRSLTQTALGPDSHVSPLHAAWAAGRYDRLQASRCLAGVTGGTEWRCLPSFPRGEGWLMKALLSLRGGRGVVKMKTKGEAGRGGWVIWRCRRRGRSGENKCFWTPPAQMGRREHRGRRDEKREFCRMGCTLSRKRKSSVWALASCSLSLGADETQREIIPLMEMDRLQLSELVFSRDGWEGDQLQMGTTPTQGNNRCRSMRDSTLGGVIHWLPVQTELIWSLLAAVWRGGKWKEPFQPRVTADEATWRVSLWGSGHCWATCPLQR